MPAEITVREALENALTLLESEGYSSGDIHDDLLLAIGKLEHRAKSVMDLEL